MKCRWNRAVASLIVAAAEPDGALPAALRPQIRHGLTEGLVCPAEADPDMAYESRLELARQLRPNLPVWG